MTTATADKNDGKNDDDGEYDIGYREIGPINYSKGEEKRGSE
ncbi:MAG: hypothetical protein ABSF91_06065 [Bacteroidota bacterium]|jgi:hypothetical protein